VTRLTPGRVGSDLRRMGQCDMVSLSAHALGTLAAAAALALAVSASSATTASSSTVRVLVFTKTAGFRHASIGPAVQALQRLGSANAFVVDATEDAAAFSDANLARYDAVVFALTTGDVLDDRQQAAFERYIRSGGGFVGIHSAADTEHGWPWYIGLVGAEFRSHPAIQSATISVSNARHPSTIRLPRSWRREDEWYNFVANPRRSVDVLCVLEESTYAPGDDAMGTDHPIAWSHTYDGGRAWYTGGGHTEAAYAESSFLQHVLGGILWATGVDPPKVLSFNTAVQGRRLVATLRHSRCPRCRATLRVLARGRSWSTAMSTHGTSVRAVTRRLPPGRWQATVVLEDRATGSTSTARRFVRIR
jgi:type 1 glutamine amidotransferase